MKPSADIAKTINII